VFACPLPVAHRLLVAARRSVVLGDQLRLGLHGGGEPGFLTPEQCADGTAAGCSAAKTDTQHPEISACLKRVRRLRRDTTLIEQFSVDQPGQGLLQRCLVQRRHGLEHLIREGAPQDGPQLGHRFDRRQAIQSGHEGIV